MYLYVSVNKGNFSSQINLEDIWSPTIFGQQRIKDWKPKLKYKSQRNLGLNALKIVVLFKKDKFQSWRPLHVLMH